MAGHSDADCPGWLELGPVGNGEPFKVNEQGSEQRLGPISEIPPGYSRRRSPGRGGDSGTVGATAVLFPSLTTQST